MTFRAKWDAPHPVIGSLTPRASWVRAYPADTGSFNEFQIPTMKGLARVRGDHLEILAIVADQPNQGDCGRFLAACMESYTMVTVWEVLNTDLAEMLDRRGFVVVHEWIDGGHFQGMRWRKP